jgi:AAA domain
MATNLAVPFTSIPTQPVYPLWPGWVNKRHVTLLVAPGGTGKGLLTIYMASVVSNGLPWPGEPGYGQESAEPVHASENVIIVAPEDDPNEAVAPRLIAANADMSRVFNLTILPDGKPFQLPTSMPELYSAIKQIEESTGDPVGLVIIDPLYATLAKGHTVATNGGAREITAPLEKLANTTVVLTHHTVKSGKTAGAKGLTDSVRQVVRLETPDKRTELTMRMRELSIEKSNNGSDAGTLRYILLGDDTGIHLGFPPSDSDSSEARGYTINKPVGGQAPVPHDVRLIHTVAGGTPQTEGTFTSPADAQVAAEQVIGYPLPWKAGSMHGMQQAVGTRDATVHTFTVMDLTVAAGRAA